MLLNQYLFTAEREARPPVDSSLSQLIVKVGLVGEDNKNRRDRDLASFLFYWLKSWTADR